jgi:hypothetical protein
MPKTLSGMRSFTLEHLHDQRTAAARQRHAFLLENYSQVADLVADMLTR